MKMAVVSMEMTPGAIPRSGGAPEQRLLSPETCFRYGGGYETLHGISSGVLGFSHLGAYIGEWAMSVESRGGVPTWRCGQGVAHAPRVWAPCGPPSSLLRTPGSRWKNKNVAFCFVQFREYFLCRISETKNSRKQGLALRHLVNRLVPENASK